MDSFGQHLPPPNGGVPLQELIDDLNLNIPHKQDDNDIDMDLLVEESITGLAHYTTCYHCMFIGYHHFKRNEENNDQSIYRCRNCENLFLWGGLRARRHALQHSMEAQGNKDVSSSSFDTSSTVHKDDVKDLSARIEEGLKIDGGEETNRDCDMNQVHDP